MKNRTVRLALFVLYTGFLEWLCQSLIRAIDGLRHSQQHQDEPNQMVLVVRALVLLALTCIAIRRFTWRSALAILTLMLGRKTVMVSAKPLALRSRNDEVFTGHMYTPHKTI